MTPPDQNSPQEPSQEVGPSAGGACPLTPPAGYTIDPVVVAYLSDARAVEPGESG